MGGRTDRLIAEIEAIGGKVQRYGSSSGPQRFVGRFFGGEDRNDLLLQGSEFDDAWLSEHNDLRVLHIDGLIVSRTSLSREGFRALLSAHQLTSVAAFAAPIHDEDLELLSNGDLSFANLLRTDITGAALESLGRHQLVFVGVAGTEITAEDLQAISGWTSLTGIGLDGRQLTPETVKLIGQLRINYVILSGPDVTDETLALLAEATTVTAVTLDQTAVTPDGIQTFRELRPNVSIDEGPEGGPWYDW